ERYSRGRPGTSAVRALAMMLLKIIRRGARLIEGPARRFVPLDSHQLLAVARRRSRDLDFEDMTFLEGLDRLLHALVAEARLNLLGRIVARDSVLGHLANRLRLEADRRQHPEIAAQRIDPPIVITGPPPSGSSLLA